MTNISKPHLLAAKGSPNVAEFREKELERRLSLYQVFMKLYEHHSSLLDEILQLENLNQPSFDLIPRYIQGIVDDSVVYVMTNLCEGRTLILQQPQRVWTIGRACNSGIHLTDKHLSRRHAAIQYIDSQGFYLIDFNSTNGSYVNGEPIYQPKKLKDGDRIRLGDLTFSFFSNHATCVLPTVAVELFLQLVPQIPTEVEIPNYISRGKNSLIRDIEQMTTKIVSEQDVLNEELARTSAYEQELYTTQQSEILDSFLQKKFQ